jgi:hypothetical protein
LEALGVGYFKNAPRFIYLLRPDLLPAQPKILH